MGASDVSSREGTGESSRLNATKKIADPPFRDGFRFEFRFELVAQCRLFACTAA
jgi:hypothetical protein